ncbi:TPA: phage tail tube protein [Serratia fonticola]|uniref:phage tail tube protein n=1 Tax=Serratia fonticola TaxID=47917 RepID=UPI0034C6DAEF
MSVLTQGTQLYGLIKGVVHEIECITGFSPGSSPADQIEDTCLSERNSRSYKRGLRTPGAASVTISADPENDSHYMMWQLAETEDEDLIQWAVGWSDGEEAPTLENGELSLPPTRTWYTFRAYVSDFPFDFQANAVVSTTATMQRSGAGIWLRKVETAPVQATLVKSPTFSE